MLESAPARPSFRFSIKAAVAVLALWLLFGQKAEATAPLLLFDRCGSLACGPPASPLPRMGASAAQGGFAPSVCPAVR
jgi:hypothetical protein